MKESEAQLMLATLRVAVRDGANQGVGTEAGRYLSKVAEAFGSKDDQEFSPSVVAGLHPGQVGRSTFAVAIEDTASSMGHPDPAVAVLGSPRISLWFEIAASRLLPDPGGNLTHVGVGIFVHHLGMARVGDLFEVSAKVEEVDRRRVVFSLEGHVKDRLIALGTHQRIILSSIG